MGVGVGVGVAAAGWGDAKELAPALARFEAGVVADPAATLDGGGAGAGWLLMAGA